jgi:hypothetical protein
MSKSYPFLLYTRPYYRSTWNWNIWNEEGGANIDDASTGLMQRMKVLLRQTKFRAMKKMPNSCMIAGDSYLSSVKALTAP